MMALSVSISADDLAALHLIADALVSGNNCAVFPAV